MSEAVILGPDAVVARVPIALMTLTNPEEDFQNFAAVPKKAEKDLQAVGGGGQSGAGL